MRSFNRDKLFRAVRRIQKRFVSKGLILMYHRVTEVDLDPWSLCVTPQHFAEHLEVLQKFAFPISLKQLAQAHRDQDFPQRAVVVTFDDGYADNLYNAKPLLERYHVPATVFVTTGYLEQEREFWWDELERLLLQPGRLPQQLRLRINNNTHQWKLGDAAYYSEDEYQSDGDRKAWEAIPGSRLSFYYSIWQLLRPLPENERLHVLDELSIWANAAPTVRLTHRPLLHKEVCALAQGELVEVGAHTVTHPFLSTHSAVFQQDEIQRSKAYLEKVLSYPVTSFAYPFGNYTEKSVSLVQEAGFTCACSTKQETVWRQSDCFQFPRFEVQNWNGKEFERRLLKWFRS